MSAAAAAKAILAGTVLLIILDAGWLAFRMDYHKALFQAVQGAPIQVRYIPAAIVYIILAAMIYMFVLQTTATPLAAAKKGALLGGAMYAFYDATNLATLKGWTWEMAITDSLWGAVLSGLGAACLKWLKF
jgi:uncharacterized membrane protein